MLQAGFGTRVLYHFAGLTLDPQSRELRREWGSVVVEVDEDDPVPDLQAKLGQRDRTLVEGFVLIHERSALELAIESVSKQMVRATEPLDVALLSVFREGHGAVPTN